MNLTLTRYCAAVFLAALTCGSALADDFPSRAVNFADLNLKSQAGVTALYRRIEVAAVAVCDMPRGTRQLKIESDLKSCRADATDRAIVQANLPTLNALHLAKTGRNLSAGHYASHR